MDDVFESNLPFEDKEAATWVWKLDRGLTAKEQDLFFEWLASDSENSKRLAKQRIIWERFDKLSDWRPEHAERPNPDLLAPANPKWYSKYFRVMLIAAAVVCFSAVIWNFNLTPANSSLSVATVETKSENRLLLDDGSSVRLKDEAVVTTHYSADERRVKLLSGEAFFIVEKDVSRPFVVEVSGVDVRAVGTAFNVRLASDSVDVLVAEGKVKFGTVQSSIDSVLEETAPSAPLLVAQQRAVISLVAEDVRPEIATLTKKEIQRVLAWQHGLMTFEAKSLGTIVEELNRLNDLQLRIDDADLASLEFSGTIRSDNVEGFARLLESGFGAEFEFSNGGEILLTNAN